MNETFNEDLDEKIEKLLNKIYRLVNDHYREHKERPTRIEITRDEYYLLLRFNAKYYSMIEVIVNQMSGVYYVKVFNVPIQVIDAK